MQPQPPLVHDFGYLGIGPSADAVMRGEYQIPPEVDSSCYTAKFIAQLQKEPEILNAPPIKLYFTTDE